jgi:hypothetical protein
MDSYEDPLLALENKPNLYSLVILGYSLVKRA